MSVLHRMLGRELYSSKGLLLAITAIITVGVLCFVMMRALYHDLRNAQADYYVQCHMADFWIDLKRGSVSELVRVGELPGVTSIRTRIQQHVTVDLPGSLKPLNGLVLTLPETRQPVINDIVLRSGSYFTGRQENEIIVNAAFARAHQLAAGDTLHLLLNNRRQPFLIVGTAISSEFTYLVSPGDIVPDPYHFGVFYLPRRYAEEIFDMDGAANQIVGRLAPHASNQVEAILQHAERILEPYGVLAATPRKDQMSHLFVTAEIEGLGVFATVLPTIFLAVAALVLNVLMSRLVESQRTVIGTLKALGYTNRQLFLHFLTFGAIVGLLGGVLGGLFGYWAAGGMVGVYQQFFEFPNLYTRLYPSVYLAGLAISLLCALAGSWNGARTAVRLEPAQAMRPKPPAVGGSIWLERFTALWRRFTFPWRVALRNTFRNRLRTLVGMFAAAMGAALLVVGFMAVEALQFLIEFQFEKVNRSDLDLTFESERGRPALWEARRLPAVEYAEPVLTVPCTFIHGPYRRKGAIIGLVAGARLTIPRDPAGEPLRIPSAGLLFTPRMADRLAVREGDWITVRPSKGLRRPIRAPVVLISESYLGSEVYADLDYLSRLMGEEFALTGVQLELNRDPAAQRALYAKLKELPALQGSSERAEIIENLQSTLVETQMAAITMLVGFAGLIFFGSVLNASLVSLTERLREIATLRVLGYGPWEIGGLLLRESMLVNLAGTLGGLPLGWLLFYGLSIYHDVEFFSLPVVMRPWIWGAVLALAILFALAAQAVVQWRIHRLDWLSALKVSE